MNPFLLHPRHVLWAIALSLSGGCGSTKCLGACHEDGTDSDGTTTGGTIAGGTVTDGTTAGGTGSGSTGEDLGAPCSLIDRIEVTVNPDEMGAAQGMFTEANGVKLVGLMAGTPALWSRWFDGSGQTMPTKLSDEHLGIWGVNGVRQAPNGDLVAYMTGDFGQGEDSVVARFAVGVTEVWSVPFDDPPMGPDEAWIRGMDLLANGDPVISRNIAASDGDVAVTRLSFADGAEVWTDSFGGTASPGQSRDYAGPVAIGADDTIHIVGSIATDGDSRDARVVTYNSNGGPPTSDVAVALDHAQFLDPAVANEAAVADESGGVYVATPMEQVGVSGSTWVSVAKAANGELQWKHDLAPMGPANAFNQAVRAMTLDGDGRLILAGYLSGDTGGLWVVVLDASDGTELCVSDMWTADVNRRPTALGWWPDGSPALSVREAVGNGPESAFLSTIVLP